MIKKLAYIGLAILIISIVIFFAFGGIVSNSIANNTNRSNVTIGAHNYTYVTISPKNKGMLYVMEEGSQYPINLYLLNSNQLGAFMSYVNSSSSHSGMGFGSADNINKTNVALNSTVFGPYSFYNSNEIEYLVEDNTYGSYSNTIVSSVVLLAPIKESVGLIYSVISILLLIGIIAGIVILIYGIFKKDKSKDLSTAAQPTSDEKTYVDQIYSKARQKKGKRKKNTTA